MLKVPFSFNICTWKYIQISTWWILNVLNGCYSCYSCYSCCKNNCHFKSIDWMLLNLVKNQPESRT